MTLVGLYLITLAVFVAVDIVWLRKVALPLFTRHIGSLMLASPRLDAAFVFYALYGLGLVYFAAAPALESCSVANAFFDGLLLGLVAYGTYELTNMATLRGWALPMVVADTLWGGALSGFAAAAAVWVMC